MLFRSEASNKEEAEAVPYELAYEMYARGYEFGIGKAVVDRSVSSEDMKKALRSIKVE